jgi:hypothetical protein
VIKLPISQISPPTVVVADHYPVAEFDAIIRVTAERKCVIFMKN